MKINEEVNAPKGGAEAAALQALIVLAQGNRQKIEAFSIIDVTRIPIQNLQRQVLFRGEVAGKYSPLEIQECTMIPREHYQAYLQKAFGGSDSGDYSLETTTSGTPSVEASKTLNTLESYGKQQNAATTQFFRVELVPASDQRFSHAIAFMLFGFKDGGYKINYLSTIAAE